jgi:PAS domain S-box-containing protein
MVQLKASPFRYLPPNPSRAAAYAVALCAVLVAAGIRWSLTPILDESVPYITFYAAIVAAAWYGGVRAGLLATLLSLLLANVLFVEPFNRFDISNQRDVIAAVLFLVVAAACALLSGSLYHTRYEVMRRERQLRSVLESIADDFVAVDDAGIVSFANRSALDRVGRSDDQVVGQPFVSIFSPVLGEEIDDLCRRVLAEGIAIRHELVSPADRRRLDVSVYPTLNGVSIYARDITSRWQVEDNARFIAEASRTLAQSLDFESTLNQVADLTVPRLADWCLIDLRELDGVFRNVVIRTASPDRAHVAAQLQASYLPDGVNPHPIMHALETRESELVPSVTESWLRSRARNDDHLQLLRDMDMRSLMAIPLIVHDRLMGVLTLATAESGRRYTTVDVQNAQALAVHIALALSNARLYDEARAEVRERRQAERALRHSEERYRTLVTASGSMVWRTDAAGRLLAETSGWREYTGQSFEDMARESEEGVSTVVHPEDWERAQVQWKEALANREVLDVEYRLKTRDGKYRLVHSMGVPLVDSHGRIIEWVGTVVDIQDRREAEEQLQRAQRMETIGRLAGGVAHETNNQMMVILSFVDFLLRGDNLNGEQRSDVNQVGLAAERVADLTRQLLALSRRQVLDTKILDLDAVVMEAESVLRRTLGPEIHLKSVFGPRAKWVRADKTQLVQILVNLALNARDAMPSTGELTISTRRADVAPPGGRLGVRWPADPGLVLLSVADSGAGIDTATMERIFEPFFSTKPLGQGTGLGLSVVEGIVSQTGGDIWVESKPGYGTVITIGLPYADAPAEQPAGAAPEAVAGGHETILVVDDEEQVRKMLVRGLALGDYRVLEAAGGQEAIATLEHEGGEVQLIVTDIAMPEMSGIELANRVTALWPRIPLLFVSGHPYEVVAPDEQLISHGRFLQKPFKVDALLTAVRRALDDAPFPDPAYEPTIGGDQ